tara:strand:+ start:73 stop:735 length:663 start_codon:yes stop_codon:yes gene_type:complete
MTYYHRIAREVKNTKNYFLNWPSNEPIKLGDYGFYRGRRVEFDWQGNLSSYGIDLDVQKDDLPMSESCRSSGSVNVAFDTSAGTPASATLGFSKKHSIAFESHGGLIERVAIDPLLEKILAAQRDGKVSWNPEWVVITQIYRVNSFSAFVSGARHANAHVIAKSADPVSIFGLADPSIGLSVGNTSGMASTSVANKGALPYFVISKVRAKNGIYTLERYG